MKNKQVVGRIDKIDFPELGLNGIEAKIDSGAYTCSIHCESLHAFYKENDHFVEFTVHENNRPVKRKAKVFASQSVKNSFGQVEYRYTIKTTVVLFGKGYMIELALTDRSSMKYPVLLGRKLLRQRFIIDVTKRNLSWKQKQTG